MKTEAAPRWEDIVFEGRNKEYGAYLLRRIYSKHVLRAVLIMLLLMVAIIAYPYIAAFIREHSEKVEVETPKLTTVNLDQPPPITPNQPPPPKLDVPPPVKTIKYVAPKVTKEEVVEEEMPTQEELKQVEVSTVTQEGTETVVFDEPVEQVVAEGNDDDKIFTVVEQQPEYPGGMEAMSKFISKNLRYPSTARRMGVDGKVFVQFVVDKEGKISDVQVIKGVSADCDKEAVRVVQMMPAWKPGKQNGKAVKARFVLPIRFKLDV